MLKNIMLSFISLFVAVNTIGLAAIFVSLTEHASAREKSRAIKQSLITAVCLGISFLFLGNLIFEVLRMTFHDFLIAGGIILFCVAMSGIIRPGTKSHAPKGEVGVVPLGTPLIVGPAFLTVSLISLDAFGAIVTLISIVANIIVVWIFFLASGKLLKVLGKSGTSALSKVANLLLASIAIMLIRKGVVFFIKQV
ncbi:MAG: MarC family protein [Candidatus Omnitrophota bacterium]